MTNFSDFENQIYFHGTQGTTPLYPLSYEVLEKRATAVMDPRLLGYVGGGAGDETTQNANVDVFKKWGLWPRMLRGAKDRDLSINLFGMTLPSPIFMAPIGVLGLLAKNGDLEVARAARATGVPMVASTLSAAKLEDVREELGETPGFFQLYCPNDRELAESLVHRAEAAGFKGIVVTLDTWITGYRPKDLSNAHLPMLRGLVIENYRTDPRFLELVGGDPDESIPKTALTWATIFGGCLTWEDLPWLRSLTKLPILLKGIVHPDDAKRAIDAGMDGIYHSNHGGRQANGGVPALQSLEAVVEVAADTPVIFDSGIRGGEDIVKALCLGATAVGIGRPYAWGLTLGGAEGVEHVLRMLLAEADLTMAIDGYKNRAELTREAVTRVD